MRDDYIWNFLSYRKTIFFPPFSYCLNFCGIMWTASRNPRVGVPVGCHNRELWERTWSSYILLTCCLWRKLVEIWWSYILSSHPAYGGSWLRAMEAKWLTPHGLILTFWDFYELLQWSSNILMFSHFRNGLSFRKSLLWKVMGTTLWGIAIHCNLLDCRQRPPT